MTESPRGKKLGVLLVDDEDDLRILLMRDVVAMGYDVQGVARLGDAQAALLRGGIDVVVTDLNLHGESGLALVAWITASLAVQPAVIVASGHVDRATRRRLLEAGVTSVLEKPFLESELADALRLACKPPDDPEFRAP